MFQSCVLNSKRVICLCRKVPEEIRLLLLDTSCYRGAAAHEEWSNFSQKTPKQNVFKVLKCRRMFLNASDC